MCHWTFWAGCALVYMALQRFVRYQRRARLERLYPSTGAAASTMTLAAAQQIVRALGELEFPFTYEKALQFALFRTYGIPSISRTLVRTGQFTRAASAAKRYTDTGVLISSMVARDWGSRDWVEAIARINCLHGLYRGRGITDEDMLYTLALFVVEPLRWIARYEWREMSRAERLATGVFWKGIADAMLIRCTGLPGCDSGQGWRDGLHWLEELEAWTEAYEARCMVPDQMNHDTAEHTTVILLWPVPRLLKPLGKQAVCALMDTRLRVAMLYDPPPSWVARGVRGILGFRRLLLKYVALPRPGFMAIRQLSTTKSPHGTFYMNHYVALPYYVKPTIANRWGPQAWMRRIQGLAIPGDEGEKYSPNGYKSVDVGPPFGKTDQKAMEEKVEAVGRLTYPLDCGQK